ncbi:hypothetical protein GDO86_005617 [Hymenochirus boettgeri]|uniref:Uncharacterized protein n=1 Tax=Hymenochirus boettgeri TaxID=247094 RepID=A0A8T2J564_9PIPI|nr:hypothetical protein GDO86_005617 [Hymenochirus boettgeri]
MVAGMAGEVVMPLIKREKGYDGTSKARMEESKERNKICTQMSKIEHKILDALDVIKKTFNDKVSFKGRPYVEKLHWDKTEMLYWLQQERNKSLLEKDFNDKFENKAKL